MRLLAISDLHISHASNMEALKRLEPMREDTLILAGDICETATQLAEGFEILKPLFKKLIWVPGNHELWTTGHTEQSLRGEAKYMQMVDVCRSYDVATPEDRVVYWEMRGQTIGIVPLFLLYDYSFRPNYVAEEDIIEWASETSVVCADEFLLHPDPYPSRSAWCQARCRAAYEHLKGLPKELPLVLVNHYPFRSELVKIPMIPRFSPWCGTEITGQWHKEFNVKVVVYGHLHTPKTNWIDGVRFEEVSLGYPRQWSWRADIDGHLRTIIGQNGGFNAA